MKLSFIQKIALAIFWVVNYNSIATSQNISNSVLSNGQWFKIGVTKSGIHKIDANFLNQAGFSINQIDPRNIHIFGNGGGMLPQNLNTPRAQDLVENHIFVSGESDGVFDNQDFILFYAEGPDQWDFNDVTRLFEHQKNIYADTNYYFIRIDENPGARLATQEESGNATTNINTFLDYDFHELDENNVIGSGRQWYGEVFSFISQHDVTFPVTGLTSNSSIHLQSSVMARDTRPTSFELKVNNNLIGEQSIASVTNGTYDFKGRNSNASFTFNSTLNPDPDNLTFNVTYNQQGGNGTGYLNYLRINYFRDLRLYDNQTRFSNPAILDQSAVNYQIENISNETTIWDISDPLNPKNQSFRVNGTRADFSRTVAGLLQEFIVFQGNNFESPFPFGAVANQNLHALEVPNLVIVTPILLLSEAQRLASFRQNNDGLKVAVVTTQQVYNEFSSGKQDITAIRDFMKFLYDQNTAELKYLLLFGDASYDYKDRITGNSNLVPIYESRESLHPIFSYSSDDYFGFMDDDEGDWVENSIGDHDLEIGIGRIPVKNINEARVVVDKLIAYDSDASGLGSWRNTVCFVADDGDSNIHQRDADQLAEDIEDLYADFNTQKLYLDAFEQVPTANGELSPIIEESLNNAVERGVLILNFTGHGGEIGWTDERILDIPQIKSWQNPSNLPLFVTATCEFGRFEDPEQVSGAEEVILSPRGGGIGLITTTRPVFSSSNFALNRAFYEVVFEPIDGEMPRLGDLMVLTKNNSLSGSVNRNFSLLGDPSMRLAYPKEEVVITEINGQSISSITDSLNALERVRLAGQVRNLNGSLQEDFQGTLEITVFDKRQTIQTIGTSSNPMLFQDREIMLFKGQSSIINGHFTTEFIIPRDIDYTFGQGKISLYAKNDQGNQDANGASTQIIIGGSFQNAPIDNSPPQIGLFLEDESFVSGNEVNPNALLIARLNDENGINISEAGIGHEITAWLDENQDSTFVLNEYYTAQKDDFTSGTVLFPLENLSPGKHKLTLKAWDTHNNSATQSIEFEVASNAFINLENVINYPNPVRNETNIAFDHNKSGLPLQIQVDIIDSQGKIIRKLESDFTFSDSRIEISWDGLDQKGQRLQNGVYFYRLKVFSPEDQAQTQVIKRIVFIN